MKCPSLGRNPSKLKEASVTSTMSSAFKGATFNIPELAEASQQLIIKAIKNESCQP